MKLTKLFFLFSLIFVSKSHKDLFSEMHQVNNQMISNMGNFNDKAMHVMINTHNNMGHNIEEFHTGVGNMHQKLAEDLHNQIHDQIDENIFRYKHSGSKILSSHVEESNSGYKVVATIIGVFTISLMM